MPGKGNVERAKHVRTVVLRVGGHEVPLNGFVMDVFQETVCGLVRALGTEDVDKRIEVTIEPAPAGERSDD